MLNEKYSQLAQTLTQATQAQTAANEELITRRLASISEDIHWLLLIAGFTMFEVNAEVDQARIPNEIMTYSIRCSQFVNMQLVNDLMSRLGQLSPVQEDTSVATSTTTNRSTSKHAQVVGMISIRLIEACLVENEPIDPITSLFFSSFRLCELEIYAKNMAKMFAYLSPQVSETLVWFLRESVRAYVYMAEKNYEQISAVLHLVFAQDTTLGPLVLNFLMRKIIINFHIWSAENTITSQSAKLLLGKKIFLNLTRK